jgi:hypothetical protein
MASKNKTNSNDFLSVPGIGKKAKNERGRYLKKRIDDLFMTVEDWLEGTVYKMKRITIDIDDIKITAAEIFNNDKLIATLKPTGLWGFGTNCQINIESKKGTSYIFDVAKESSEPDWKLINKSGGNPKNPNKIIFRNLIRKLD